MRILLDENLDWRLGRELPGHEVCSVPLIGWAGTKNGALIDRASRQFDVLITMDNAMAHDRRRLLEGLPLAVVALRAPSNRLADTRHLMPKLLALLPTLTAGTFSVLG
ncbi:MAG: DUF5615 family PIN-like protein [Verrucomicrobia bacterium]|nr:DUF5615 family PIN-like protein [Verrucomicrobiota bacterium]